MFVDQTIANRQITALAGWFPMGSTVQHVGQPWRVIGHREVGQYGPWLSIGAIPILSLQDGLGNITRLSFDSARGLMAEHP
jgi:hypothetical protein